MKIDCIANADTDLKPVLRWAGSKRKLIPDLKKLVPSEYDTYIEPFSGSACLFFELKPAKAILGDINPDVIGFYKAMRAAPVDLLSSAKKLKRNQPAYYRIRDRFNAETDPAKRAPLFLYLNRFCFNGIFRANAKGEFNVPFGTRTGSFPLQRSFVEASVLLKRAKLFCVDFDRVLVKAKKNDFVYLDPPYMYQNRKDRGEYGPDSFSLTDLPRLFKAIHRLDRRGARFLFSYLDCEEIEALKKEYQVTTIPVSRSVAGLSKARKVVSEVMISNF